MLFFELFPAFMALVSLLVGVGLYISHRRARNDPPDPIITAKPASSSDQNTRKPGGRRPSMSA